ncbi:hypothetical protein J2T57_000548 [Natronocella acetinitrilica]|uniref:Uncharacterized protein n=1 Tax=Natronocella acetinitrilica TaxID=414046 RepID=A0AAE3G0R0_9GAMM|nr:hypothetical protein [Natronocella acetinitrilica]
MSIVVRYALRANTPYESVGERGAGTPLGDTP